MKKMKKEFIFISLLLGAILLSCNSKPEKIEPLNSKNNNIETKASAGTTTLDKQSQMNINNESVHKVTVVDSLSASRYVYLKVKEGARNYWISTWKMPFKKGDVFFYKGGILKLNFYSKEHNMYFDTLYLISKISKVPVFTKTNALDKLESKTNISTKEPEISKEVKKNIVKLKDLFANPEKYKGKIIKISGKCTKVNMNIMGKNWIHIQEKGIGDKVFDLVVMSKDAAQVGENCYFEGKIDTKLDLGAGYFFDVIMQEGKRIY